MFDTIAIPNAIPIIPNIGKLILTHLIQIVMLHFVEIND